VSRFWAEKVQRPGQRLALCFPTRILVLQLGSSRESETPICKNSMLAIISLLLLINGIDVTVLWAGLAKRSKEISCSRNPIAACDFYDARQTFCAISYKNLVEKSARHASGLRPGRRRSTTRSTSFDENQIFLCRVLLPFFSKYPAMDICPLLPECHGTEIIFDWSRKF